MTTERIIIAIVGAIVMLSGIFNVSMRKDRWLYRLIGETGYRILMVVLGFAFLYLALFTNYFA
jgi:small neutral amino acid transporter SnatA (MarC family)